MKIKNLNENSNTRLKSALFGDVTGKIKTFAILTAENPMAKQTTPEKNNRLISSLKVSMKKLNLQYVPVEGRYGSKEHSFMIMNIRLEDALLLAIKYLQESFFFATVSSEPHGGSQISFYEIKSSVRKRIENANTDEELQHVVKNLLQYSKDNYNLIETSDKIDSIPEAEDFFSRHGNYKFSISMKVFEELNEIKDREAFEESFKSWRTPKSAANMRAYAYNGKRVRN